VRSGVCGLLDDLPQHLCRQPLAPRDVFRHPDHLRLR
jgi:hypothetical protein